MKRLLDAVRDVAPADHPALSETPQNSSARHRAMFDQYRAELAEAKALADFWWEQILESQLETTPDRNWAERIVSDRRPVGPAAHPRVIGVVRKFWLLCTAANASSPPNQRAAPEDLVLRWLGEGADPALAEFIVALPFWPIGMDVAGRWC